jgi:hypothetical protein
MSLNGSPLENPLHTAINEDENQEEISDNLGHTVRKRANSIVVKRCAPPTLTHSLGTKTSRDTAFPVQTQGSISVTTQDGHVLEFDPFTTNPSDIDNLEGVSDAAKQTAKDDVVRFISGQMAKWTIS